MPTLEYHVVKFGCDPEFFFSKEGAIVGAEKILPKEGFKGAYSKIVIDGVQAEINPAPEACRANLANEISRCLYTLKKELLDKNKGLSLNFNQTVTLTKKELNTLSDKSKTFGCAPSINAYKERSKINVKRSKAFTSRSAGGHLHFGDYGSQRVSETLKNTDVTVPLLDYIVGNTCVLMDRDKGNIKRRKLYGRAGEFRLPKHGLEYRTLSNFWMKNYALMSFVMGLARQAIIIGINGKAQDILSKVRKSDIKKAINNNDATLARINFEKIAPTLCEFFPTEGDSYPLTAQTLKEFIHFTTEPLDYWFKEDPLEHWIHLSDGDGGHNRGWGEFIKRTVRPDLATRTKT